MCIWNEDDTCIGHPDGLCMVTDADNVCQQNVWISQLIRTRIAILCKVAYSRMTEPTFSTIIAKHIVREGKWASAGALTCHKPPLGRTVLGESDLSRAVKKILSVSGSSFPAWCAKTCVSRFTNRWRHCKTRLLKPPSSRFAAFPHSDSYDPPRSRKR